jgi:hypothetical protein
MGYEARPLRGRQVEEGTGKTLEVKRPNCGQWQMPPPVCLLVVPDVFWVSLDKPKQNCRQKA